MASTVGAQKGTLTIAGNDPSSPAKDPVSGQVFDSNGPVAQLNFGELDFGSVKVGQPATQPLMVYNAGGANVVVSSVTFSNPVFTAVSLTTPLTVTPGSTATMTVRFAPTAATVAAGPLMESMVVNSNDPAYPAQTVVLTGTGVASGACTYSLSSGGQAFGPSSASGTINITAPPGCAWTVAQLPSWITLTNSGSGTGNGTVTFSIQANSGADLSASITIGGTPFLIEQQGTISGLSLIGSMPHLAAEGGWLTTFTFVNKSASSAIARTNLFAPGGSALTLPVNLPQQAAISGPVLASSLDQTIAPNASFVMQATGPTATSYLEGSAQLAATGAVDGFAIFHYNPTQQEAVVPMETRTAPSYLLAFDNTNGVLTGIALENVSTTTANITVTIRNDAGAMVTTGTIYSRRGRARLVRALDQLSADGEHSWHGRIRYAFRRSNQRVGDSLYSWDHNHDSGARERNQCRWIDGASCREQRLADDGCAGQHRDERGERHAEVFRRQRRVTGAAADVSARRACRADGIDADAKHLSECVVVGAERRGVTQRHAGSDGIGAADHDGQRRRVRDFPLQSERAGSGGAAGEPQRAVLPDRLRQYGADCDRHRHRQCPADQDQLTKSQGRSYVSSDGINFSVVDSFGANVAGNFGIRAMATLGGP